MDPKGLLPEDLFLDVLRRLVPRSLAVSRFVCKAWRAAVDNHCADLLHDLPLEGIILELYDPRRTPPNRWPDFPVPVLFSRPSIAREIPTNVGYPPDNFNDDDAFLAAILDSCNGLLLLRNYRVVNPATRQWVEMPQLPGPCWATYCYDCDELYSKHLVFDPAVSPHYEVFSVPHIPNHECKKEFGARTDWPPNSPYITNVFSSRTGQWAERSFLFEGMAAADCRPYGFYYQGAAYCHGALYINFEDVVLRLKISNNTYQVIELPKGKKGSEAARLGKSEKGMYCSYRYANHAFQIWFLDESRPQIEWVLKSDINFAPRPWRPRKIVSGSWILHQDDDMEVEEALEDTSKWVPDHANVVSTEHWVEAHGIGIYDFLGFHPSKEIALLAMNEHVMAYHLNTSMVRHLGEIYKGENEIQASFPYTPCWMGPLPGATQLGTKISFMAAPGERGARSGGRWAAPWAH